MKFFADVVFAHFSRDPISLVSCPVGADSAPYCGHAITGKHSAAPLFLNPQSQSPSKMPTKHAANYDITVVKITGASAKKTEPPYGKTIATLNKVKSSTSIGQLKKSIEQKSRMSHHRQSIRLGVGREFKNVKDECLLEDPHDFKVWGKKI